MRHIKLNYIMKKKLDHGLHESGCSMWLSETKKSKRFLISMSLTITNIRMKKKY